METGCRELKKNSEQISEANQQICAEAQKNRDEIVENFEKNISQLKLGEEDQINYTEENEKYKDINKYININLF